MYKSMMLFSLPVAGDRSPVLHSSNNEVLQTYYAVCAPRTTSSRIFGQLFTNVNGPMPSVQPAVLTGVLSVAMPWQMLPTFYSARIAWCDVDCIITRFRHVK